MKYVVTSSVKPNMKHFLVLLLLATGKLVCAEILHYDMFLWGEKIGTLTISKTTNEEKK